MPYGESNARGGSTPQGIAALDRELNEDVIPLVERRYRVIANRENRAIAGLSMGGGQALTMGLTHLDRYAWVGEFSSGMVSAADFKMQNYLPEIFRDVDKTNRQLHLLFISCGTEDPRYPGHVDLVDDLKAKGLHPVWYSPAGAHEMKVWRHSLEEFLPRLFKAQEPAGRRPANRN